MDLPICTLEIGQAGVLSVNMDPSIKCWRPLWFLMRDALNKFIRFGFDNRVLDEAKYSIDGVLCDLKNKGYLYKDYNNEWQFDVLRFSLNCIGWDFRRGKITDPVYSNPHTGYSFHAEALIENNGELCQQVKLLPAETIEQLQEIFKDSVFNEAVELYKNHYIEVVAGI